MNNTLAEQIGKACELDLNYCRKVKASETKSSGKFKVFTGDYIIEAKVNFKFTKANTE